MIIAMAASTADDTRILLSPFARMRIVQASASGYGKKITLPQGAKAGKRFSRRVGKVTGRKCVRRRAHQ
jgi:hypothetical protein